MGYQHLPVCALVGALGGGAALRVLVTGVVVRDVPGLFGPGGVGDDGAPWGGCATAVVCHGHGSVTLAGRLQQLHLCHSVTVRGSAAALLRIYCGLQSERGNVINIATSTEHIAHSVDRFWRSQNTYDGSQHH